MDEYEKWLESQWDEWKNDPVADSAWASGNMNGTNLALQKYRSMTCKMEKQPEHEYEGYPIVICSACKIGFIDVNNHNYCPNCGRKVIE